MVWVYSIIPAFCVAYFSEEWVMRPALNRAKILQRKHKYRIPHDVKFLPVCFFFIRVVKKRRVHDSRVSVDPRIDTRATSSVGRMTSLELPKLCRPSTACVLHPKRCL